MSFLLTLDQGTSSSRALLFDREFRVIAMAQQPLRQIYPQPGWVEHDAEEIWQTQLSTARQVLESARISGRDIVAIGIANQRETAVVWDRQTGTPVHNAIVWQDRRTADTIDLLKAQGCEPMVRSKTGLVLDPYFSATKIAWILDNVSHARTRALSGDLAFGTIDSWLLFRLTGGRVHATDTTNACRTMLYDIISHRWDPELLDLFRIPGALLPRILPSSARFGDTDGSLFGVSIPVTAIIGDQQAALMGQMCIRPGLMKNTYGTGCFLMMNSGAIPSIGTGRLLATVAWQFDGRRPEFALEGSVFTAGAAIQWLRDGLGIIRSASEVNQLAAKVPDSGGVFVIPAFTGLGAPHWDPSARAAILGMTRGTSAAHIARATLEGIAFQTIEVCRLMAAETGIPLAELRVDGGASASDLLMQIQADLLGIPICRPAIRETTALGTAYLAGLGSGMISSPDELSGKWRIERVFEPRLSVERRDEALHRWSSVVERVKRF